MRLARFGHEMPSYFEVMDTAVQMTSVVKTFGSVRALDGVDLEVNEGEVHGFLGPNGSGKTTTLRVLLGFIRADGGTTRILGADPWQEATAVHGRLAYVPGEVALWPSLTGAEVIALLGRAQGHPDPGRVVELIESFELDPTRKVRTYSKGNRQKVALVAALAADAELYLLDEPTIGLDPIKAAVFGRWVRRLRAEGRTVLLSSHILSEVQELCDRVSILRAGRTVDTGVVENMRHLAGTQVVARLARVPAGLADIPGVRQVTVSEVGEVTLQLDDVAMPAVLAALVAAGVERLSSQSPTLEDLFMQHYATGGGSGSATSRAAS